MIFGQDVYQKHNLGVHRTEMDAASSAEMTSKQDGEMPKD
jgi:hypothetical protein